MAASLPLDVPERAQLTTLVAVVILVALSVPRLRPLGAASAPLVVLAAVPWPGAGPSLLLALVGGVAVAAGGIDALLRVPVTQRPHPLLRAALAVPAVVLVLVGALFLPIGVPDLPHRQLAAWLTGPSAAGEVVAVPTTLRDDLVRDGVPVRRLRPTSGTPTGAGWTVLVGDRGSASRAAARFGSGASTVTVLQPPGADGQQPAQAVAVRSRGSFGGVLARIPSLTAPPEVLAALRAGDVDPRVMTLLAGLAVEHTLEVGAVPAVPGEEGLAVARHVVLITGLDGRPTTEPATAAVLGAWLRQQLAPYSPAAVADEGTGTAVAWSLPVPSALLPG